MEMYVTYRTTREELYWVDIDENDWEEYVKTLPPTHRIDPNEAYNYFMNLGYPESYADGEDIEQVVERVEFKI